MREQFNLKKFRVKAGRMKVCYILSEVSGDEVCENKYEVEIDKTMHTDLKEAIQKLTPIMQSALGMGENLFSNGVSINNGIVVLYGICNIGLEESSIKTPRISLDGTYGYEGELFSVLEEIENEIYLYLFEDKKSTLQVLGDEN